MAYSTIIYTSEDHIASITLNRPEAGNSLNLEMAQELAEVCRLANQDEAVYVVTVTGSGDAFCSFGDGEPGDLPPCHPAAAIASIEKPVIAAINGDALGPGLELALSCDIRLASDKAKFGFPEVARGLIPAEGGTQRLPRIVGRGKALEMILTAGTITAKEALEIGLVGRIVPRKELLAEAEALAKTVAAKGPIALKFIKEAVNKGLDLTLEQGLRLEADLYFLLHTTEDRTEGITSFLGKRKPKFKGK
jgi:enoyl-CoA hydratase